MFNYTLPPENIERFSLRELLSVVSVSGTRLLVFVFEIYIIGLLIGIVPKPYRYDVGILGTERFLIKSIKK